MGNLDVVPATASEGTDGGETTYSDMMIPSLMSKELLVKQRVVLPVATVKKIWLSLDGPATHLRARWLWLAAYL